MTDRIQATDSLSCKRSLALALKQATETIHLRLHRHPLLLPLHENELSLEGYVTILRAFHRFHAQWEPSMAPFESSFMHIARPLQWLAKDFTALGLPCPPASASIAADTAPEDMSIGLSDAVGYLYVKQGSTLGGQCISRHIQAQLGLAPDKTLFFFHGFGRDTGPYWKAFLQRLELFGEQPEFNIEAATLSAVRVFESLERCLDMAASRR